MQFVSYFILFFSFFIKNCIAKICQELFHNTGPGYGLVPSENKREPKLTKIYVALWRLFGTMS